MTIPKRAKGILKVPSTSKRLEDRFKRELLLARKVTHKNVVRIHDIGEVDGVKYITMPYVEGSDLATLLKTEDKLTVPRALRMARRGRGNFDPDLGDRRD